MAVGLGYSYFTYKTNGTNSINAGVSFFKKLKFADEFKILFELFGAYSYQFTSASLGYEFYSGFLEFNVFGYGFGINFNITPSQKYVPGFIITPAFVKSEEQTFYSISVGIIYYLK